MSDVYYTTNWTDLAQCVPSVSAEVRRRGEEKTSHNFTSLKVALFCASLSFILSAEALWWRRWLPLLWASHHVWNTLGYVLLWPNSGLLGHCGLLPLMCRMTPDWGAHSAGLVFSCCTPHQPRLSHGSSNPQVNPRAGKTRRCFFTDLGWGRNSRCDEKSPIEKCWGGSKQAKSILLYLTISDSAELCPKDFTDKFPSVITHCVFFI